MDIADYLPWVRRLAQRFHRNDRDDCVQVGLVVVAKKLAEFDASRGIKFETFAGRRVLGAMLDYLRSPYRMGRRVPLNTMATLSPDDDGRAIEVEARTDAPSDLPRCIVCGEPFQQSRAGFERMCSVHCRGIWWARNVAPRLRPVRKPRPMRVCTQCGVTFFQRRYGKRVASVCGRRCRALAGLAAIQRRRSA